MTPKRRAKPTWMKFEGANDCERGTDRDPDDAYGAHRCRGTTLWPALEIAVGSDRWLRSRGASGLFGWHAADTALSGRSGPGNREYRPRGYCDSNLNQEFDT